ncbi:Dihydrofolate reductase [Pseudoalteromonas issachenkonii]|jgi:dihydrofolate reductase|nr:Dihydrofolate reductase [Pseudoalteromonas issachenkonii]KGJ99103.1 Dihydrofolate reductase [Pseudoalteromonas sp. ND6B]MAY60482.1 type 3 dihydrofolate reductase [Pseudoalteromonas sp.]MCP4954803.1 type 3 dihydrofolate reductase [Photobacterium aquimaris]TMP50333.1 type 3 dihydrofolate reductase [Pseudoalteromonas sp. S1688]TMS60827.1 type 3 dihydrofolate reductase [Pseudoalteromonas sp. S3173]TMS94917.1 type 3 dihydrofolate reductase [Pseudoalteromonas sp. S201]SFT70922.1 dihydrofolate r|tara:strand:+ start:381 stop:860 length:480 start_codon:yes stop_codon:yes gene_type:complete
MIAAMANNRVIGLDNKMPWHLPGDLQHFKKVTSGKPVIMGRKTFESIGRPLPGRRNIIITRNKDYHASGIETVTTPEAALELVNDVAEVMIIGGGNIYQQFLAQAQRLYLTFIDLDVEGDTQFPDYKSVANWQIEDEMLMTPDDKNKYSYKFVTLNKVS